MTPYFFTEYIMNRRPITLYDAGLPRRDWTFVEDIVSGIVAALDRPLGYEVFNLGNSHPIAMREFVSIIEDLTGVEADIVDEALPESDPPVTFADISKTRRMLGYEPLTSAREGMSRFMEWYRSEVSNRPPA